MSKRRSVIIADPGGSSPKSSKRDESDCKEEEKIDWSSCFICQTDTDEKLQSSSKALTADKEQAYKELAKRIAKFDSIDMLPVPLDIDKLKEGVALGDSLIRNEANFHKSCKLKFSNDKLNKAIQKYQKSDKIDRGTS